MTDSLRVHTTYCERRGLAHSYQESFGIEGYRPTEWGNLEETLRDALLTDEMSLVEIPVE